MTSIVALHGIAQEQLGRNQLRGAWRDAARDGLERALDRQVGQLDLDIAYYGSEFLRRGPNFHPTKGPGDEGLGEDELARLVEAVGAELDAAAANEAPTKGFPRMPQSVLGAAAALDARLGQRAKSLLIGELAQVRRYLTNCELKDRVDSRVADIVGAGCDVLIGHSLGSVVALEFIRQNPQAEIECFLTLGSPLGLRLIRSMLPDPEFGRGTDGPRGVARWCNLFDRHDPVTLGLPLRPWWPSVEDDDTLDNGDSPHKATRYLGKQQTGEVLLAALPRTAFPPDHR